MKKELESCKGLGFSKDALGVIQNALEDGFSPEQMEIVANACFRPCKTSDVIKMNALYHAIKSGVDEDVMAAMSENPEEFAANEVCKRLGFTGEDEKSSIIRYFSKS